MHADVIACTMQIIVDDLFGNQWYRQSLQLKWIERLGGVAVGCAFLIELDGLMT